MAILDPNLTALCADMDADLVKEIVDTSLSESRINNFINMAYYISLPLVGRLAACGASTAHCAIIQLLAAHLLTLYEPQKKSENIASEWSFTNIIAGGLGLDGSTYGQAAKTLDCSGTLASLGKRRARIKVWSHYERMEERGLLDTDLV